jgi:hypothetical protein
VALPRPVPGLVVRYAYLWRDEARRGQAEGRKDRPCVIVVAVEAIEGRLLVTVAPVTHTPPEREALAVEIPSATKRRLGLDGERSWIVAADLNRFSWPGVDLRPVAPGSDRYAYGLLPANLYRQLRERILAVARSGAVAITPRTD